LAGALTLGGCYHGRFIWRARTGVLSQKTFMDFAVGRLPSFSMVRRRGSLPANGSTTRFSGTPNNCRANSLESPPADEVRPKSSKTARPSWKESRPTLPKSSPHPRAAPRASPRRRPVFLPARPFLRPWLRKGALDRCSARFRRQTVGLLKQGAGLSAFLFPMTKDPG